MYRFPLVRSLTAAAFSLAMVILTVPVGAQVFDGGGLQQGVGAAGGIQGPVNKPFRQLVIDMANYVINFLALVAVIVIIIAGIRLIVSQGEDEQKDKAKKTIIWAVIGLLVVLFAKLIVAVARSIALAAG